MSTVLPAYYRELGRIANDEFIQKKDLSSNSRLIIMEAAANAFGDWAMEELNQIDGIHCEADLSAFYKVKEWKLLPENQKGSVWVAANEMLSWLHRSGIGNSQDIYKWLCRQIRDEEKLNIICKVADRYFLKKD